MGYQGRIKMKKSGLARTAAVLALGLGVAQTGTAASPDPQTVASGSDPQTVASGSGEGFAYVHHPVSTGNAAAQAAFDRGLTLVFAYQEVEAEQAFRQAARLDPSLAMAWWGIALSLGPDINEGPTVERSHQAAEALERAAALAAGGTRTSALEREYIAALRTRYSADPAPDFDRLATGYRDAMRELVARHPEDADARSLFAEAIMDIRPWRLWSSTGEPEPGTAELVNNLETGLAAHPDHLGLTHFYIHAVEASNDPGRALSAARRLAALPMEPAAAHLVHMPAHIYMRVGDWQAAVEANDRAVHHALDYRISNDPKSKRACGHCVDFLTYAYMMQGAEAHARQSADSYQQMTGDSSNTLAVLIRFHEWKDLLAMTEPLPTTPIHNAHALLGLLHFGRGLAQLGERHPEQADKELEALRSQTALAPPDADFSGSPDVAHVNDKIGQSTDASELRIAAAILESRLAESRHRVPIAIERMRQAVTLQDEMTYNEPPGWFYPVRESLGSLLLRTGRSADAERVFRNCLRLTPNDPRCLLGLSAALERQGHASDARRERALFDAAWAHSDSKVRPEDL